MDIDRLGLAEFLRTRREALQPEDVGLTRGPRRRATGLRREEVAALCGMSVDYYSRLERERGPQPSESMLAAIARGLRLSLAERDHLFLLAGHGIRSLTSARCEHVDVGLMRVMDRLQDTPALIVIGGSGETLHQTPPAVALFGDQTNYTGLAKSGVYRWFTDPRAREVYAPEGHDRLSRFFTAGLREAATKDGPDSRAAMVANALREESEAFAAVWAEHRVGLRMEAEKHLIHPEVGDLELYCQVLVDPTQAQSLLIYTATPGSVSHDRLQLLSVIGSQNLTSASPD